MQTVNLWFYAQPSRSKEKSIPDGKIIDGKIFGWFCLKKRHRHRVTPVQISTLS